MSSPEAGFDAPPDPVIDELRDEVYTQRMLLTVSLICLIVLTLSIDRYFWKQIKIEQSKEQANQNLVTALKSNPQFSFEKASDFWNNLVAYSKTHPDAAPLINKYSTVIGETVLTSPPAKR